MCVCVFVSSPTACTRRQTRRRFRIIDTHTHIYIHLHYTYIYGRPCNNNRDEGKNCTWREKKHA